MTVLKLNIEFHIVYDSETVKNKETISSFAMCDDIEKYLLLQSSR